MSVPKGPVPKARWRILEHVGLGGNILLGMAFGVHTHGRHTTHVLTGLHLKIIKLER